MRRRRGASSRARVSASAAGLSLAGMRGGTGLGRGAGGAVSGAAWAATAASRRAGSTGLVMQPSMPAARHRASASGVMSAVRARIGRRVGEPRAAMRYSLVASTPSSPGMFTSSRARWMGRAPRRAAASSASSAPSPSSASTTSCPPDSRMRAATLRFTALSSATSTRRWRAGGGGGGGLGDGRGAGGEESRQAQREGERAGWRGGGAAGRWPQRLASRGRLAPGRSTSSNGAGSGGGRASAAPVPGGRRSGSGSATSRRGPGVAASSASAAARVAAGRVRRPSAGERGGEGFGARSEQHGERPGGRLAGLEVGQRLRLEGQAEGAAGAGRALDAELAAEQPGEAARDGQAEAGAPETLGDLGAGLGEAVEDARLRLGRDANAGVGDLDRQAHASGADGGGGDADGDAALGGELHGVAGEVQQDLAQVAAVEAEAPGHAGAEMQAEAQAARAGLGGDEAAHLLQQLGQVAGLGAGRHAPGLDAGEVEDLVDQLEQGARGEVHRARHVALVLVEPRGREQPAHADDGVERRAQLVADIGKEERLRLARRLRLAGALPTACGSARRRRRAARPGRSAARWRGAAVRASSWW
jgi:hypothetical protein